MILDKIKYILIRILISFVINMFYDSGIGRCHSCRINWHAIQSHDTSYDDTHACFPLCEICWDQLSIHQRLRYYRKLFDSWRCISFHDTKNGEPWNDVWEKIEKAVIKGL